MPCRCVTLGLIGSPSLESAFSEFELLDLEPESLKPFPTACGLFRSFRSQRSLSASDAEETISQACRGLLR